MADDADLARLSALQSDLAREVDQIRGFTGVGIGLGRRPGTYAFHVMVTDRDAVAKIPDQFQGVEVFVDVVGRLRAS
jgi:hypothetical protein